MPLPAALQQRLQRRGLVKAELEKKEEPSSIFNDSEVLQTNVKKNFKSTRLPPGWFKVPEPQRKREYYWNVHTNQVSWRHPLDPLAEITYPATWQQKNSNLAADEKADDLKRDGNRKKSNDIDKSDDKVKSRVKTGKHPSMVKAHKQKEKMAPYRKKNFNDELDPMDPASYSDIARGTWSSGLIDETEQKSGVDTTANGPLFQQRPYPSPGDILRKNKKKDPDHSADFD